MKRTAQFHLFIFLFFTLSSISFGQTEKWYGINDEVDDPSVVEHLYISHSDLTENFNTKDILKFQNLSSLAIRYFPYEDSTFYNFDFTSFKNLRSLEFSDISNIGVPVISNDLEHINLPDNHKVHQDQLDKWIKNNPDLEIWGYYSYSDWGTEEEQDSEMEALYVNGLLKLERKYDWINSLGSNVPRRYFAVREGDLWHIYDVKTDQFIYKNYTQFEEYSNYYLLDGKHFIALGIEDAEPENKYSGFNHALVTHIDVQLNDEYPTTRSLLNFFLGVSENGFLFQNADYPSTYYEVKFTDRIQEIPLFEQYSRELPGFFSNAIVVKNDKGYNIYDFETKELKFESEIEYLDISSSAIITEENGKTTFWDRESMSESITLDYDTLFQEVYNGNYIGIKGGHLDRIEDTDTIVQILDLSQNIIYTRWSFNGDFATLDIYTDDSLYSVDWWTGELTSREPYEKQNPVKKISDDIFPFWYDNSCLGFTVEETTAFGEYLMYDSFFNGEGNPITQDQCFEGKSNPDDIISDGKSTYISYDWDENSESYNITLRDLAKNKVITDAYVDYAHLSNDIYIAYGKDSMCTIINRKGKPILKEKFEHAWPMKANHMIVFEGEYLEDIYMESFELYDENGDIMYDEDGNIVTIEEPRTMKTYIGNWYMVDVKGKRKKINL